MRPEKPLAGKVALVAGATRGAGRGIAVELGAAGATVYGTGRSTRAGRRAASAAERRARPFDLDRRPETIEETAEMVTARGGHGVAGRGDHTVEAEVRALFDRIRAEQGRLDILVNDVWGGDELMEWGKPFWELDPGSGRVVLERAVYSHLLTNRYGAALMIERNAGLIVEVTDGEFLGYRGNLHYDLAKVAAIRLAYAMAAELRGRDVVALAVTPGFLRSEAMLDHFGVTEETWREAVARDRHFAESETPYFLGRGVAALAADPDVRAKSGTVVASWELAKEYGFTDVDGRRPDWGGYFERVVGGILDRGRVADDDERFLLRARYHHIHLDHRRAAEARRIAALLGEA